ncbi:MAG: hypothetical protein Q9169_007806 [Polycauliona sp. 2 TL-2023]
MSRENRRVMEKSKMLLKSTHSLGLVTYNAVQVVKVSHHNSLISILQLNFARDIDLGRFFRTYTNPFD